MQRRVWIVIALLLALGVGAYADVATVIARDLGDGDEHATVAALLTRRLEAELTSRGFTLWDAGDQASGSADPSEPRVSKIALGDVPDSVDLLIAAFFRMDGDAIVIQFVLIDPLVDIVVGGVLSRQRTGLTIANSVNQAIEDLRPALDRWEGNKDVLRRGPPPDKVDRIIVTGTQEDVRVRFAELEVGEVSAGRIVIPYSPFPVGTSVPVTLSKPGYHDRTFVLALDDTRVDAKLPTLPPSGRVGLSVIWTSSYVLGGGVGLRYYSAPDLFYGFGEYYQFRNPATGGRAIRVSDARLGLGLYLFSPEAIVRPFGEISAGLLITDLENASAETLVDDAIYSDAHVGVSFGAEANLGRTKPFIRADVGYALGITANNLLGNRWLSPPLTSLPIPIPMVTVGVQHTW